MDGCFSNHLRRRWLVGLDKTLLQTTTKTKVQRSYSGTVVHSLIMIDSKYLARGSQF
jgi:hypothetical protein